MTGSGHSEVRIEVIVEYVLLLEKNNDYLKCQHSVNVTGGCTDTHIQDIHTHTFSSQFMV